MASRESDRMNSAQQTLDSQLHLPLLSRITGFNHHLVLFDISQLLNTQLDKETLATCVGLIESGVNPEALAVRLFVCCHIIY
jgi:mitotic-spindle organizing protein 1